MAGTSVLIVAMVFTLVTKISYDAGAEGQQQRESERSCYPPTGDLLIGRQDRLFSSSTCGLHQPERYCVTSYQGEEAGSEECFFCDSRTYSTQQSHRIEFIVSADFNQNWRNRWWQAENGKEDVYIQLDLEEEFHFMHLIMQFQTIRPAAMLIEKSQDFGQTWKVYRYFADNCEESFPGVPTSILSVTDVICESRYSGVTPTTEGEVIFRVLPPSLSMENTSREDVQDLLKMTNLRVNFTKLHTPGDGDIDKYYYSVIALWVRGSCSCYGHASRCIPLPDQEYNPHMVHGKCDCIHNTTGTNCQECEELYNDLPWRPAHGPDPNSCKRCECHGHAMSCHFDTDVYESTGQVSGGVCDKCGHNTTGRNCELCKPMFFHDPTRSIDDPNTCRSCDCDISGSEHGGTCESHTDVADDLMAGRCLCKRYVEGVRCDQCRHGYWNLSDSNPEGCQPLVSLITSGIHEHPTMNHYVNDSVLQDVLHSNLTLDSDFETIVLSLYGGLFYEESALGVKAGCQMVCDEYECGWFESEDLSRPCSHSLVKRSTYPHDGACACRTERLWKAPTKLIDGDKSMWSVVKVTGRYQGYHKAVKCSNINCSSGQCEMGSTSMSFLVTSDGGLSLKSFPVPTYCKCRCQ